MSPFGGVDPDNLARLGISAKLTIGNSEKGCQLFEPGHKEVLGNLDEKCLFGQAQEPHKAVIMCPIYCYESHLFF